jgi:VanZ family protein
LKAARIAGLWLPVAGMMGLLFYVSSRSDVPAMPSGWDKLLHLGAYGLLGLLSLRAVHGGWGRLTVAGSVGAVLLAGGYGIFDELHQSRVAGRHASVGDWLADLAGVLLALVFVATLLAVRKTARAEGKGTS